MLTRSHLRVFLRWVIGILFIIAGANHFRVPETYVSMIPPALPSPHLLNWISGAAEILGGIGVLIPAVRTPAAWGLILLLIAVFPANLHIALHGWPGMDIPRWVLWVRLPFQGLFIAAVYWACLTRSPVHSVHNPR